MFGNGPLIFQTLKKSLLQVFATIRTRHNIEAGYFNSYSTNSAKADNYLYVQTAKGGGI